MTKLKWRLFIKQGAMQRYNKKGKELCAMSDEEVLQAYAKTREDALRWELVLRHMDRIEKLAGFFDSATLKNVDRDDLRSAAIVGLASAVESYSPDKARFVAYARVKIRGAILDYIRKIMPSRRVDNDLRKRVEGLEEKIRQEKCRDPLSLEVTEALNGEQVYVGPNLYFFGSKVIEGKNDGSRIINVDDLAAVMPAQEKNLHREDAARLISEVATPAQLEFVLEFCRHDGDLKKVCQTMGIKHESTWKIIPRLVKRLEKAGYLETLKEIAVELGVPISDY